MCLSEGFNVLTKRLTVFLCLSCTLACDGDPKVVATPDLAATDMYTGAVLDMPVDEAGEELLRPNVQTGLAPNALNQTPAFEAQTRAPQPAQPAAVSRKVFATGLEIPWGIAALPDGRLLVTERPGRLRLIGAEGSLGDPLKGVPDVAATGQGGLLDVALSPNFSEDRAVFLSYSESKSDGMLATVVARATLSDDEKTLQEWSVLYRQTPARATGRHFGSRLVFDRSGALFATFGDRGDASDEAQSPLNGIGAVIRILPDGGIPEDNPFSDGEQADPAVWSWGHRNIQSATLDLDGVLWTVEHGPRGGDELNRPEPGVNHGWPIITYGVNYNGSPVGEGLTAREGMAQPVYFWDPVIAPSGMATYTGELFTTWQGDLLIGGLRAEAVVRLKMREGRVYTEEWIDMGARVRCIAVANDGAVLVGTDAGEIVALRPE